MRGGGLRSSAAVAANAAVMLATASAAMPMVRAVCAIASGGRLLSDAIGTAMRRRARPVKLRRNPSKSLVASMPTINTTGRDTRSSRSPSAAAMIRPPSGLWPPSSQISLPAGARATRGPVARRCMRASQVRLVIFDCAFNPSKIARDSGNRILF